MRPPLAAAPFVTRFAPSPTGLLHLGHAAAALRASDAAREADGRFLLRIEDIDTTRSRRVFEAAILEDLTWLGLAWEAPVRRQSEHGPDYGAALERLRSRGLLYRCFRTRREIAEAAASAPHGPEPAPSCGGPLSPQAEREALAQGRPFAWRLSLDRARDALGGFEGLRFLEQGRGPQGEHGERAAELETAGDVVLARKDIGVAYHLAVVVDDALQGVTHVIRGEDLFAATSVQRLLQALLQLPTPVYRHHPLLRDAHGRRLAKREGARPLAELRAQGVTPQEVRRLAGLG